MSDKGLIIVTRLFVSLTLLVISFKLETKIKRDGIYVRFFPFHLKFNHCSWDSLSKSFVRKYFAITEYGGWGLKCGLGGKGKAYKVSGNYGLQLVFKTNEKLLIGTNKADELTNALHKIGQLKQ